MSVLGFVEHGEWVALALEMDLRGYGKTFEDALARVAELVEAQISFAYFKRDPDMIWRPADPVYSVAYAEHRNQRMRHLDKRHLDRRYQIASLPVPPNVVRRSLEFALASA